MGMVAEEGLSLYILFTAYQILKGQGRQTSKTDLA